MNKSILWAALACLLTVPAAAEVPLPVYPECGTPQRPDLCPVDLGTNWELISYIPEDWASHVRPEEIDMGTGVHVDRAWARTTGAFAAIVAGTDAGMQWHQENLLNKHFLNAGELPYPQNADGLDVGAHDLNGDGVFNMEDWMDDPRIDPTAGVDDGDHMIDPSDLIHGYFGVDWDDVDNDGNGYIDDISGWDFFWNDKDAYDETDFGHGYWALRHAAAEGGDGGSIGTCPNCATLALRVSDSFVSDGNHWAQALLYATDMGAVSMASIGATMNNSTFVREALDYAWYNGLTIAGSAADEAAFHPMLPAANPHNLYVNNVRPNADDAEDAESFLQMANCTNYSTRTDITVSATGCSSRALASLAGIAGLVSSAGMVADGGDPIDPPLNGNEVYQVLINSADDVHIPESYGPNADTTYWPMREGFDAFSGYGRANARSAVDLVLDGNIPPEADILSPEWFVTLDPEQTPTLTVTGYADARRASSFSWVLQAAAGFEPAEADWFDVASGGPLSEPLDGELGTLNLADLGIDYASTVPLITEDMDNLERAMRAQMYTGWVRVVVTDDQGHVGQMRRSFHVHHDADKVAGWPLFVGSSVEASPNLFDFDGDGDFEIIIANADAEVFVLDHTGEPLPGWPVILDDPMEYVDPADPANHLASPAFASGAIDPAIVRESVISSPAVEDLDGDGSPEVVVANAGGKLFALAADGTVLPGFPVEMDFDHILAEPLDKENDLDFGFFGAVALGDLDADGDLEIVAPGMDQYVYAWHHDGEPLSGWPVLCQYLGASSVQGDRIISSPAIGDLDGDGFVEVLVGSNESINTSWSPLYAIHHDGNDHAGGPYVDGWPITMSGFYSETLPYVGEGCPASPALTDLDGDGTLEVACSGMTDWGNVYNHDGTKRFILGHFSDQYGPDTNARDETTVIFVNSMSLADLDNDGVDEVIDGGLGIGYITSMAKDWERLEFDHFINAWEAGEESLEDGTALMKRGFPQQVEGLQFFQNPAVADLDGDDLPEVIEGSGEYILHAFDVNGAVPEGWPKFVGEWIMASPAVGDIDGDGYLEVLAATRGGWVHAWHTTGRADTGVQWASFHHDSANTGNAMTPLPAQAGPTAGDDDDDDSAPAGGEDDGCGCTASGERAGAAVVALLAGLVLVISRRRRV